MVCKCKEPTIVIGRKWTIKLPPSDDIKPDLKYICATCGLTRNYN